MTDQRHMHTNGSGLMEGQGEQEALEHALGLYHANTEGVLEFDGQTAGVKFVRDPKTGQILCDAPAAAMFAAQHVLYVPEYNDEALQLLLTVEETDECDATDRYQAYHGDPNHVHWARCFIDSVRHSKWVFDGDAFMRPNPLNPCQQEVCTRLNEDKERLANVVHAHAATDVQRPTCVGVDPWGIDIRARFGIVRVPFDLRLGSCEEARAVVDAMIDATEE